MFVLGHCLFLEAHSFPRALLSENCSLLGTGNVRGQMSEHIFAPNEGYCLDITRQTNIYERETIASLRERGRLPLNSRFKTWPEDGVTGGDIKAFLAMIIAIGLVNQENIQDYWSTNEVLSTPFFPQLMSRDF